MIAAHGLSLTETKTTINMLRLYGASNMLEEEFLKAYNIIMLYGYEPDVPAGIRIQCQRLLQLWFDFRGITNVVMPCEN